ncbi:AlkA N-terminal domain-containing protein [Streptomyces sp. NPDC046821]|uniref:DNA-3-methyladenine glycosylase 2 family protein n=1 Tax=Streptomyces sp. NPDC046821 TaxID=3154702 RepID=UPI0033FBDFF0
MTAPEEDTRYEAVRSRDARFDGEFFFAVETTGIYCRPSCPAVTPKRKNVCYYATAAAAQGSGFRACRRCRPDSVPGSAEWNVRADVVGRAMRMIGDGVVDREGVAGLAVRLGYSARHVQRQLTTELGAGPVALARAQRAHAARVLLQTTDLPITEIAFAAGFASVRQFNDTMRAVYARTPTELRGDAPANRAAATTAGIPLRLAHRGPYQARPLFDTLAREALAGVEEITGTPGTRTYRRTLRLPYGTGVVSVDERTRSTSMPASRAAHHGGWLDARIHLTDLRDLTTAVGRLRRLFDLDSDPYAIDERLGADPRLAPLVAARPGLRSPGAADPDELAVRLVAGPAGAALLVERYAKAVDAPSGTLTHVFPTPDDLAGEPGPVGVLATALADGTLRLGPGADRDDAEAVLRTLPGVDDRTAALIRMRCLGDPDMALPTEPGPDPDPGQEPVPDAWRPWRSYAQQHLWTKQHPSSQQHPRTQRQLEPQP